MKLDTIITGGTLVTTSGRTRADLGIGGEKIVAIGRNLASVSKDARIIDAKGLYVIPAGVDVHVHLDLPFMDSNSSDDYNTGTRAAARGGITTVVDFAIPYGEETMNQAVDNWFKKAEGIACVDYGFHGTITNHRRHLPELPRLIERGIPTAKEFMIYANMGWQSDDDGIFAALEECRRLGAMLMIHAESSSVLSLLTSRVDNPEDKKKYGARLHTMTRPHYVETEAVQRAIKWCEVTGGKLFIVHLSTGPGADLVKEAQGRGVNVLAETCAHYLVLDDSVFGRKDGHLFACQPQVKTKADQKRLWQGLRENTLCNVSTDTCTFTTRQKSIWNGDYSKIPMGMPGLETLLPIVYTHGVLKRQLTLEQFVRKCCTDPAKVMGMYPRKGSLEVGTDADIAIIHPTRRIKVDWHKMETNADWSPYQDWELAGFAETTLCRGAVIVEDYKFTGQNGHGCFVPRKNPGNQ
ncbi:MAG: dihydropyrimidinase [Phycisphaerae bacterium]|nr:dihydropyrimidinase [Phycisphaerae bacterium]